MSRRLHYQAGRIRALKWKRYIFCLDRVSEPRIFMRDVEAWAEENLTGPWSVHVQDYHRRAVIAVEMDSDAVLLRLRWECHRSHTDPKGHGASTNDGRDAAIPPTDLSTKDKAERHFILTEKRLPEPLKGD